MNEQSPVIPDTDVFEINYSLDGADTVLVTDYALSIHDARKMLRKSDTPVFANVVHFLTVTIVFTVVAAVIIGIGVLVGNIHAAITVAKIPVFLIFILAFFAVIDYIRIIIIAKKIKATCGKMTFSADGIKDEANDSTHAYAWEKLDMCVVTEKVIVFIFKDAGLFLFIPTTEEAKQTVIGAFRRFGHFDDVLMRSVK